AELTDQLGRRGLPLALAQRVQELLGAGARDGADVLDDLVAGHAHSVVVDAERPRRRVGLQANLQLAGGQEVAAGDGFEPELVERVRGIRDQLAEEDVLVGVEGVDHEVQQLPDLRLELAALCGRAHTDIVAGADGPISRSWSRYQAM